MAVNPYGRFLVVWWRTSAAVIVFAYDRDGGAQGYTNLGAPSSTDRPMHLAPGTGDGFVAAWESWDSGIEAVRLDRTGARARLAVHRRLELGAFAPRVATTGRATSSSSGPTFTSDGDDTSGTSIQARWFAADGAPLSRTAGRSTPPPPATRSGRTSR